MRSWRNRQTRTFEGRVGDHMGSSPIDRTTGDGSSEYRNSLWWVAIFSLPERKYPFRQYLLRRGGFRDS